MRTPDRNRQKTYRWEREVWKTSSNNVGHVSHRLCHHARFIARVQHDIGFDGLAVKTLEFTRAQMRVPTAYRSSWTRSTYWASSDKIRLGHNYFEVTAHELAHAFNTYTDDWYGVLGWTPQLGRRRVYHLECHGHRFRSIYAALLVRFLGYDVEEVRSLAHEHRLSVNPEAFLKAWDKTAPSSSQGQKDLAPWMPEYRD